MSIYYLLILVSVFLLVGSNTISESKIYASNTSIKIKQKYIIDQLTHQNKSITLPLNKIKGNVNFDGIIDSTILLNNENLWIGEGNWNLVIEKSVPSFELNMTWYSNDDSNSPITYRLSNYKSLSNETGNTDLYPLFSKGLIDVLINNHTLEKKIPIIITISKNNLMNLFFYDKHFYEHFAKQPIFGIVKTKSNLLAANIEQKNTNNISQLATNQLNNSPKANVASNENTTGFQNQASILNNTGTTFNKENANNTIIIPANAESHKPSFLPNIINVIKGSKIYIINKDSVEHTITSMNEEPGKDPQIGIFFNTGYIKPQEITTIDTSKLNPGKYSYGCNLHPDMRGIINIT